MKNLLLIISIFALTLSCVKKNSAAENSSTNAKDAVTSPVFPVDSVVVDDSATVSKTVTAGFKTTLLVFPSLKNKPLLDSIYAPLQIKLTQYTKNDLQNAAETLKKSFYDDTKASLQDWTPDFEQRWNNNSKMKVFSNTGDFLTLQYSGDGYTGGAHGYYFEYYKVFDLKENKTLQLSDILSSQNPKIWSRILMTNFVKNDKGVGQSDMLLVKEIPLNNNFYFDNENLCFLYNQYEIAAYAAGPVLIKVPLSDIKPMLTDYFKTKTGLK